MDNLLRAERDSIAVLGLLARTYFLFDPPITVAGQASPTHVRGLNVHCFVIDNTDGEVLAAERNLIHAEESPLQHAEQRGVRAALERLRTKRPRSAEKTVEKYYQTSLFMAEGTSASDYLRKGCTLYNMFDPCAMCAVTLIIAYMKRIAYVLEDHKFAGFYQKTKEQYFASRQSMHGRVTPAASQTKLTTDVGELLKALDIHVNGLLGRHINLINVLDYSRDHLATAAEMLRATTVKNLATKGDDFNRNERTLVDVKRSCNLPL